MTPTSSPSLYDLLDVDSTASDAEIRAAWRSAIADLDPSDRRFRAYNQAAEVLLDPNRRAAYDAELTTTDDEETEPAVAEDHRPPPAAAPGVAPTATSGEARPAGFGLGTIFAGLRARLARPRPAAPTGATASESTTSDVATTAAPARQPVPGWLLIGLAVAVAILVAGVIYFAGQPSDTEIEESTRAAQSAAERAIVPVLSYDAKTLDDDQAAAEAQMTSDYRKKYDQLFEAIKENAPRTGTSVSAEVVASGIVRSGEDRAQILLFVNRPTTNKARPDPVVFRDQVTVTMQRVGGDWLVDDLTTSPVAP